MNYKRGVAQLSKGLSMKKQAKILLIFQLSIILYWILAKTTNVYKYAVTGAIYELLWQPAIAITFSIPFISAYFWIRAKCKLDSVFLAIILLAIAFIMVITHTD